ncbi:Gfo/Idh/MocA family oxidoreductase [Isosphaeraceae bacterium EP7]
MIDRRRFLQTSAAGSLALGAAESRARAMVAGKKYKVGVIGCGWFGNYDLDRLRDVADVEVVSMCDVDSNLLNESADRMNAAQGKRPKTYADFREMLKPRELDIVIVATPDHWHALTMIAAVDSGADVYVEKPISHTVDEGKAMVAAARRTGRVVQVGTQRRSTPHIVKARDFLKEGHLGKVGLVKAYCYWHMRGDANPPDSAPPANLDYEMWTGPAPMRPYSVLTHPRQWRKFTEYCSGITGDMAVHMLDAARYLMGVRYPRSVSSSGGIYVEKKGKANTTDTQTITLDYGDLTAIWEHRTWGKQDDPKYGWGVNFYGDKGTLKVSIDEWDFIPEGDGKPVHMDFVRETVKPHEEGDANIIPGNRAHWRNFLEAIEARSRPVADIEEGHVSTTICHLGNISMKLGRSLAWDGAKERVIGDDEANALLRRDYRAPWVYPTV